MRKVPRRLLGGVLAAALVAAAGPARAESPDPVIASTMSAGATVLPLTLGAILLGTGRGKSEGVRFDAAMIAFGLGSTVGPSAGQIYARGGVDAFVTFLLRTVTSGVMLTGIGFKLRGADNRDTLGAALAVTGGIPTGLLALYDIYAASVSAREARYESGYAGIDPGLLGVAVCGPIPCGTDDARLLSLTRAVD